MSGTPTDLYDQLLKEVQLVRKYVTGRSDEEILAYLEAHFEDLNRVETVVRELRDGDENEENFVLPAQEECGDGKICVIDLTDDDDLCAGAGKSLEDPQPSTSASVVGSPVEKQVETLMEMFPDGDPEFFGGFVRENFGNTEVVQETVNLWLESRSYKKLEQAKKDSMKRKFAERNFTVEEFLEMFPEPEKYFNNTDRAVTPNYKKHIYVYALNNYPSIPTATVAKMLIKHKYHLIPFVRQAKCFRTAHGVEFGPPPEKIEMPQPMDELFYKELQYLELADEIKDYQNKKKDEKRKKIEEARCVGTLMTCECCFEDELLLEDMLPCINDHLFCKDCIRRQAEINIGANNLHFPCFNGYCKQHFSMTVLQSCLKPNIFSIVLRKVQEEEIRQADIPDLEACPFCSFCAIMPDTSDKVFKCLNPECLKESCRLCKEPNHVPLRCNEIENKTEVDMRTFIENKMTDALLRTCPSCKRRFIKDYGCNKMTCTCGQTMCYMCRQPISDYEHFEKTINGKSGKCQLYSNDLEMNSQELQKTAAAAREEYIKKHPESANIELRYDPTKHISSERRVDFNYEEMMFNLRRRQREMDERIAFGAMNPGERLVEKLARLCEAHDRTQRLVVRAPHHMFEMPYMPDLAVPLNRRHGLLMAGLDAFHPLPRRHNFDPELLIPRIDPFDPFYPFPRRYIPPLPDALIPHPQPQPLPHPTPTDQAHLAANRCVLAAARTLVARRRPRSNIPPATDPETPAEPAPNRPIVAPKCTEMTAPNVVVGARAASAATATGSVARVTVSIGAPRQRSAPVRSVARPVRTFRPSACLEHTAGGMFAKPVVRDWRLAFGTRDYFGCRTGGVVVGEVSGREGDGTAREDLSFGALAERVKSEEQPRTAALGSEEDADQQVLRRLRQEVEAMRKEHWIPLQMYPRFSGKLVGGKELQSAQHPNTNTPAVGQPLDEKNVDNSAVPTTTSTKLKDVELDKPPEDFVALQKQMLRYWSKQQPPVASVSPNSSFEMPMSSSESDLDE